MATCEHGRHLRDDRFGFVLNVASDLRKDLRAECLNGLPPCIYAKGQCSSGPYRFNGLKVLSEAKKINSTAQSLCVVL